MPIKKMLRNKILTSIVVLSSCMGIASASKNVEETINTRTNLTAYSTAEKDEADEADEARTQYLKFIQNEAEGLKVKTILDPKGTGSIILSFLGEGSRDMTDYLKAIKLLLFQHVDEEDLERIFPSTHILKVGSRIDLQNPEPNVTCLILDNPELAGVASLLTSLIRGHLPNVKRAVLTYSPNSITLSSIIDQVIRAPFIPREEIKEGNRFIKIKDKNFTLEEFSGLLYAIEASFTTGLGLSSNKERYLSNNISKTIIFDISDNSLCFSDNDLLKLLKEHHRKNNFSNIGQYNWKIIVDASRNNIKPEHQVILREFFNNRFMELKTSDQYSPLNDKKSVSKNRRKSVIGIHYEPLNGGIHRNRSGSI